MAIYTVKAKRVGKWWALDVPEVDAHTQVRRLDQAEAMAREAIALTLDVDEDEVDVELVPVLSTHLRRACERVESTRRSAEKSTQAARDAAAEAARRLHEEGELPLRDVGILLGVSHQRAHQLVS